MNDQLWNCPVCGTLNSGDLYCGCGRSCKFGGFTWKFFLYDEDLSLSKNGGVVIDPDDWERDYGFDLKTLNVKNGNKWWEAK